MHWFRVKNGIGLTLGAPNWYQWVLPDSDTTFLPESGIFLVAMFSLWLVWAMRARRADLSEVPILIQFALLSVLIPPFFLPGMHERYFFSADILSFVYALYIPKGYLVAILVQCASLLSYAPYLFQLKVLPSWALAIIMGGGIVLVFFNLCCEVMPSGKCATQ